MRPNDVNSKDFLGVLGIIPGAKEEKQQFFADHCGVRVPRANYESMWDRLVDELGKTEAARAVFELLLAHAKPRVLELLQEAAQGDAVLRPSDPALIDRLFFRNGRPRKAGELLLDYVASRAARPARNLPGPDAPSTRMRAVDVKIARPIPRDATADINSLLPPAVAVLRGLSVRDQITLAKFSRHGLNEELEFERRTGIALKLLGLDVHELGQGTGRQADGVARCPEHHWALVYDAKLRAGVYRIGTEDRKFREYIEHHHSELQRAGIPKMYFAIVSAEFHDPDLEKAKEMVRLTSAKSCVLLTVEALLTLVERRLDDPRKCDPAWLERQLVDTRILRAQDVTSAG